MKWRKLMQIARVRLLIIALIIAVVAVVGAYAWFTWLSPPWLPNSAVKVAGEGTSLDFAHGQPYIILDISNNAKKEITIAWVNAKIDHVLYLDHTSEDVNGASVNSTLDLHISPSKTANTQVTLPNIFDKKTPLTVTVEYTIRIKEIQEPITANENFTYWIGPRGPAG